MSKLKISLDRESQQVVLTVDESIKDILSGVTEFKFVTSPECWQTLKVMDKEPQKWTKKDMLDEVLRDLLDGDFDYRILSFFEFLINEADDGESIEAFGLVVPVSDIWHDLDDWRSMV
jgi:hypothetical protein